jgi:hypothetical protein
MSADYFGRLWPESLWWEIPVTVNLGFSLHHGKFPVQHTEVSVCHAPVAIQHRRWSEGMNHWTTGTLPFVVMRLSRPLQKSMTSIVANK